MRFVESSTLNNAAVLHMRLRDETKLFAVYDTRRAEERSSRLIPRDAVVAFTVRGCVR